MQSAVQKAVESFFSVKFLYGACKDVSLFLFEGLQQLALPISPAGVSDRAGSIRSSAVQLNTMLTKFETKSNRVKGLSFHPKR